MVCAIKTERERERKRERERECAEIQLGRENSFETSFLKRHQSKEKDLVRGGGHKETKKRREQENKKDERRWADNNFIGS